MKEELHTSPEEVSLHREAPEIQEHLSALIEAGRDEDLRAFIKELYPSDIAFLISGLGNEPGYYLFRLLEPEERGEVLAELETTLQSQILAELTVAEISSLLQKQPSDRAALLLADLESTYIYEILAFVPTEKRVKIIELLGYPEGSAGALMGKEFVAVRVDDTVKRAISSLRRSQAKNIHNVYVLDEEGRYKGHVGLARLVLAKPQTRIGRVMEEELMPIPVETDQEEVANYFTRYDFIAAPVVNQAGAVVGHITADDVLKVVQEEASEDILRMGGVWREETLNTPSLRAFLHRIVWLGLNLLTVFLSVLVIRSFEETIEKAVILAALMPVVTGLGGSASIQSISLVTRNIALGELTPKNAWRTLFREISIALMNGLVVGLLASAVVYAITGNLRLMAIMFFALYCNMIVAAVAGSLIPQFLRYLHIDPAVASGILVTTCTDFLGLFIFLGSAYLVLNGIP